MCLTKKRINKVTDEDDADISMQFENKKSDDNSIEDDKNDNEVESKPKSYENDPNDTIIEAQDNMIESKNQFDGIIEKPEITDNNQEIENSNNFETVDEVDYFNEDYKMESKNTKDTDKDA